VVMIGRRFGPAVLDVELAAFDAELCVTREG